MNLFCSSALSAQIMKADLKPFGAASGIFYCPLDPYAGVPVRAPGLWGEQETSYNESLAFAATGRIVVTKPYLGSLVSSTMPADPATCGAFFDDEYHANIYDRDTARMTAHGSRSNVVFADGHTKGFEFESAWAATTGGCKASR